MTTTRSPRKPRRRPQQATPVAAKRKEHRMDTVFSEEALTDLENAGRSRAEQAGALEANRRALSMEIAGLQTAIETGTTQAGKLQGEAEAKVDAIRSEAATAVSLILDVVATNQTELERRTDEDHRLADAIRRAQAYAGHAQRVVDRERVERTDTVGPANVTLALPGNAA